MIAEMLGLLLVLIGWRLEPTLVYTGIFIALASPFASRPLFRIAARRQSAALTRRSAARLLGEKRVRIADDGLHVDGPGGSVHVKFVAIERIGATPEHLFVISGVICVAAIPARAVGPTTLADFREELRRRTAAAPAA